MLIRQLTPRLVTSQGRLRNATEGGDVTLAVARPRLEFLKWKQFLTDSSVASYGGIGALTGMGGSRQTCHPAHSPCP